MAYPENAQRFQDPYSDAYAYQWQRNDNSIAVAVHWPNRKIPAFYAYFKDADKAQKQMQHHFANYRRQFPWSAK